MLTFGGSSIQPASTPAGSIDALGIRWVGPILERDVVVVYPTRGPGVLHVVVENPGWRQ
jgi:hypothetical protein